VRTDEVFTAYTGDELRDCTTAPATDVEERALVGEQDCVDNTITTTYQERTREYVWTGAAYEPGEWSEWLTVDTVTEPAPVTGCPAPPEVASATAESVDGCEVTEFGTTYGAGTVTWVETVTTAWEPSADGMEWVAVTSEPVVGDVTFDRWSVAERVAAGCIEILNAEENQPEVASAVPAQPVSVPTAVDAGAPAIAPGTSRAGRGQDAGLQLAGPGLLSAVMVAMLLLLRRRSVERPARRS
jgi:hypothetical protein